MASALFLGVAVFTACWILHIVIWRIRRPGQYPLWLLTIFLVVPCLFGGLVSFLPGPWSGELEPWTWLAAFWLHASISVCYMAGYVSLAGYSASAEILRVVRGNLPQGTPIEALASQVRLDEESLTGKRIQNLIEKGLAETAEGRLQLSKRGRRSLSLCLAYRAVFGIKGEPRG